MLELGDGVRGVGETAALDLDRARLEPFDTLDRCLHQRQPVGRRRHRPAPHLLPGLVRHHEEDPVEVELVPRVHRRDEVADVHGVEGPPENAESPLLAHLRSVAITAAWSRIEFPGSPPSRETRACASPTLVA